MSGFFKDGRVDDMVEKCREQEHLIITLKKKNEELLKEVKQVRDDLHNNMDLVDEFIKKVRTIETMIVANTKNHFDEMNTLKKEQMFLTNKYDEIVYKINQKRKSVVVDSNKKRKVEIKEENNV